jgi:putative hydrolase of the HAD superfamily
MLVDLDDTIIAFEAVAEPVWESLCERYARRAGKCDSVSLLNAIREVRKWYWADVGRHKRGRHNLEQARREIVRVAFRTLELDDVVLADEMADTYSLERDAAIHLFPRAEETLRHLVDHGVRLALVTNGGAEQQRKKITRFGLERFFRTVLIEGELGYGKPDQAVYLRALDDLGLAAGDVWAIGDNLEWDVAAPQQLGIYAIWHDYRGQGLSPDSPVAPDRIVSSISELMEGGVADPLAVGPDS